MFARTIARPLVATVGAVVLLSALTLSAFAWPNALNGNPPLRPNSPTGYYIGHDDNGFHLRTHGPNARHEFNARLHTDGLFENVDAVRLESGDRVAVTDGGHTLALDFDTYDATDGVNFTIRGGEYLTFDLELDGAQISPARIYLGAGSVNPRSNPFTIMR